MLLLRSRLASIFSNYGLRLGRRVNRILGRYGFSVQRVTLRECRSSASSPRDILVNARSLLKPNVLVEVPTAQCRNVFGFTFSEKHPFVATLRSGPPAEYCGSVLEAYHDAFQPRTAPEVLGLSPFEAPGFVGLPASACVMPWESGDPSQAAARLDHFMRQDARQYGLDLSLADGRAGHGPVSQVKGELEVTRLRAVWDSMSRHGYLRCDLSRDGSAGDVTGTLLTNAQGGWCVIVANGHHRTAVAAALGISPIPIRFGRVPVKREEVEYWPQVVAGRITRAGALALFDRIMRGDPPPSCQFEPSSFVAGHPQAV
jgi:hypothetical protein